MANKQESNMNQVNEHQQDLQNVIELKRLQQQTADHSDAAHKLLEEEKIVPKTFREKWDNYWYHYKCATWMTAFGVILAIFFIKDIFFAPKIDMDLISYGSFRLSLLNEDPEQKLAPYVEDLDENGQINIQLQEMEMSYVLDSSGQPVPGDEISSMNLQKLLAIVATGEPMVYLLDLDHYDWIREYYGEDIQLFTDLSEYFPNDERIDGEKLLLDQTDLGKAWKLDQLKGDYCLCVRTLDPNAKDKIVEKYDAAIQMIGNILDGQPVD